MSDRVIPVLTDDTPRRDRIEGQTPVTVVDADLRKTHPNLWRSVMAFAAVNALLGLNFMILQPTFLIYNRPTDTVVRKEMLACGHTKTTLVQDRPAARRRCYKCASHVC